MVTKNNGASYDWKICRNRDGRPLITGLFVEAAVSSRKYDNLARETRASTPVIPCSCVTRSRPFAPRAYLLRAERSPFGFALLAHRDAQSLPPFPSAAAR